MSTCRKFHCDYAPCHPISPYYFLDTLVILQHLVHRRLFARRRAAAAAVYVSLTIEPCIYRLIRILISQIFLASYARLGVGCERHPINLSNRSRYLGNGRQSLLS